MKVIEGITEQLKKQNPTEWVARMNIIEAQVKDIVDYELFFTP